VFRKLLMGLLLCVSGSALAGPVDFQDPTPRWIDVAFEVSPRDAPAQVATVFTPKVPAWVEPDVVPGRVQVTVDRHYVERVLISDDEPVPESFSEFVWIIDSVTGEVHSAELSGELMIDLDWGLFRSRVRAKIDVNMATDRLGGFRGPRHWLGQQLFGFCEEPQNRSCTLVPAVPYVATSGYVNAVGELSVRYGDITLQTFSPLGEAVFSEAEPRRLSSVPAVSAGPAAPN
jgi:hypothetical protein